MTMLATDNWIEANQRYLLAALAVVRAELESHTQAAVMHAELESHAQAAVVRAALENDTQASVGADVSRPSPMYRPVAKHVAGHEEIDQSQLLVPAQQALREAALAMDSQPYPPALETLCALFGLSPFERDVVLLCAGMELDSTFMALCATAHGDAGKAYPTFSLALAALPEPQWSTLAPDAPLRHWRLIEVGTGSVLTQSQLHIDERILHYLTGVQHLDERLVGLVHPIGHVMAPTPLENLAPSHKTLVEQAAHIWSQAASSPSSRLLPVVQLCGHDVASKQAVATAVCDRLGLRLYYLSAYHVPASPGELDAFIHLWERESALSACALLLDNDEIDSADAMRAHMLAHLVEYMRSPLILAGRERFPFLQRLGITLEVRKPTLQEQRATWQQALGETAQRLNGRLDALVAQFSLSAPTIAAATLQALGRVGQDAEQDSFALEELGQVLWESCRSQARPRLESLAQRIEPVAAWEDLVLPETQLQMLREVVAHVRQRNTVYETWGFAAKSGRGLGISALFSGASGTGKTLAAEVLAHELLLDLYHLDLSSIVSKYIGETEKNLRRVFNAAEAGGAILLFDEADALFGKRSEVKDSHDRYANIEVSYLLQRMEAYRGLAILTTNMKNALDAAFLRRIRFIVQFPFPDAAQRAEIWRRIFPANTPTEGLDMDKLARLSIAGGNIRNIALNAAFLAAVEDAPVRMKYLLQAARSEFAKLEKPLSGPEIGGWV